MNTCIYCGLENGLSFAHRDDLYVAMDDGSTSYLPDIVEYILVCEYCGRANESDDQKKVISEYFENHKSCCRRISRIIRNPGRAISNPSRTIRDVVEDAVDAVDTVHDTARDEIFNRVRDMFSGSTGSGHSEDNPKRYAQLVPGNQCGPLRVPFAQLRNSHTERSIIVTIKIWSDNSNIPAERRIYDLRPQEVTPLGCPVPGPTLQRFIYEPETAEWSE